MTNVNVHLITIEAAVTLKKEHIYHAAMLDPHTGSELTIDEIVNMVDDLIEAHGSWLPEYK
jgi:alpha-galactosidase